MWKWYSADGSGPATAAPGMQEETNTMSVMDIGEQLAQTEQLVVHLKELIREKDNQLQSKDQQLKEEKEASDAKLSKAKLQNKAKVASLSSQLEELKKQLAAPGSQQKKSDKKASGDGEQENAAANRGKILVLRRKVEELESRVSQKNEELQKKIAEVEAQRLRGSEMDAILVQKEKKLAEKEAYIIELQMAVGSSNLPKDVAAPGEDQKDSSLQDMQMLIQNLTRKVGDSEEKYSLLQEQTESLKALLSKERDHFQEREAMYVENIRMFQNIIQEKEKDLIVQAQNHEQELFKLAAKSDASADLEQLLKALKQKLHEKEEVLLGRNQVINILQKELDAKDQQLKEINERSKRLQSEKENLQSKLDAEKHVMRAQLRDMMDKHQAELKLVDGKHKAEVREIQEKHGTEIQEKDQVLLQLQKQVEQLGSSGQSSSGQAIPVDAASKQRIEKLEAQVKLKSEEVSKSEAKFFKLKSLSKSKIKQLEDELKSVQSASKHNEMSDLNERISDLENEKEQLQTKLEALSELKTQNEELHAKLELYEEQQRKLQADLEQVTKRAASQTSESGSADELQNQVLEWQEMIPGSEETLDQLREEKSAIALRMVQIEEEREGLIEDDWFFPGCSDPAIVSGQQDLEEELTSVQGMGRLPHARRKGNQAAKKPQGDYGYNSQRYEDPNITLDSVDSSEGENMGGLQTVVEELELERNQLQEQIMTLEERCQDLEDRLQLQVRIESLQNENERLQTQLMQLRSQFSREAEMHQALSSNLNEQLKGLSERKISLEISLVEKEQKLLETAGKLEQMTTLSQSFQEQDVLNKELSEKLVQSEQQLEETKNRCESYETECAELKVTNNDLIDKVNTLKEKTSKQDLALEIIHRDLDQTNEELDRLNTSHLEERSQLIHDLQRCERENDSLKETIEEKDKELASLSFSMTEYSEQLLALKQQMQYKEEEMREMEDNLVKAKRENNLLREAQSSDVQDSSIKMSALTEKLDEMELELNKTTGQNEAQANEAKELIRQINEYSETIKDLRSQIQTHIVAHRNHVMECEAQILLLKDQIRVSAEKLLETDTKQKQEIEHLHAKLEENCSSKEKLSNLLEEKEKKEQSFERELKSVKDQNNQLISKAAKKDEDLAKLSKQLEENIGHQETLKLLQQEKLEAIASLEENLQLAKQQSEDMKLKCVENERENRELKKQLKDSREMIAKLEVLKQELALNNKQLQVTLEEKDVFLSDQIRVVSDLTKSMNIVESKQQLLINENNNLLKQINDKESEVLKLGNAVMELEKKILKNEEQVLDDQNTILLLRHDKDDLIKKIEDLSVLCEQKDISISSELLEKTKECNFLSEQLSMNRESIQCLHKEMHDLGAQLKEAKEAALKKEAALQNALTQCTTLHEQLQQNQERIELFEKQIKELTADLELKSKALQDTSIHFEEKICMITGLKNEAQTMEAENKKLSQWVEERDCTLKQKNAELENLHQLNDKKVEENIAQNNQIEMLCKEIDKLKMDKEEVLVRFSNKLNECENLNTQATQNQSEVVSLKQLAHTLELENQKLKADLEIIHTTVTKKTEEIAILSSHLSQQGHTILALKDQIDNMNIEKQELQHNFYEKEAILAQRETLIQEIKEAKLTEDGRSLHTISDLQKQLQNVVLETTQLRKTIQDKENELIRQGQEIQLFKDKSEESHLFKVQLSENMEVISDLHVQIQNVNEKSEELNQLLFKKDESLKQKVGDYVNLKAKYSEMEDFSEMQQKQFEALMVEANQLKADILEKDRLFKNTSDYTDELKLKLQDKEIACESLRQQVKNLEVEIVLLKQEISNQKSELSDVKVSMAEKDNCLLEKENLIKNLKDKTSKQETYYSQLEEKLLIVSQLQSQVNSVTNELLSSKELANEKEKAFLNLQEKCADHSEQINQLNKTLGEKQVYISELLKSLNQKDISIQIAEGNAHVLTNELQLLRGEFEKKCAILKNNNSLFEEKDNIISVNQKTINSLTTDLEAAKMECRRNLDEINAQKCDMQQIELNVQSLRDKCLEQSQHIENLKSDIKHLNSVSSQDIYDKTLLIENLQLQMNYVVKEKNLLIDDIKRMTQENENVLATYQKQLLHQSEELKELHAKMEHSLKDSEVEINTVTLQMKNEKEQLQKQVSVNIEEISVLKLKLENLEVSMFESESKWKAEHVSVTQQNGLLRDQLNHLENELTSRDNTILSLQQELFHIDETMNRSELYSDEQLKEMNVKTLKTDDLHMDDDARLQKLYFIMSIIETKKREIAQLKEILSVKERECGEMHEDKIKSMNLQNDIEKLRTNHESELEHLLKEITSSKQEVNRQQSLLEKKDQMLTILNTNASFLQEQLDNTVEELHKNSETLNAQDVKISALLEEIRKKVAIIENVTSQTSQQKDLISSLSHQLKERDVSITQVMESMSNEMVRFSEEKCSLKGRLEYLESVQSRSVADMSEVSQNLEECKNELEHYKVMLTEREEKLTHLIHEKDQMQVQLEKIIKEKDALKKKLQASLVIRKDLLQKIEILERTGQDEVAKEQKKTEVVMKGIDELTYRLESVETQNNELESHQELLKKQLLEKDSDVNNLSEILAAKQSLLEQCQKNIKELNNVITEKENQLQEYLKYVQVKDTLHEEQGYLIEREKTFEDRSKHLSNLDDLKTAIGKKKDQLKAQSIKPQSSAGYCSDHAKQVYSDVTQLSLVQQETENHQKKTQASLLSEKDTMPISREDKDDHAEDKMKEPELLPDDQNILWDFHQQKCTQCESNLLLILSLQEEIQFHEANISEKEKNMNKCKLESEEKQNTMQSTFQEKTNAYDKKVAELMSEITTRDLQLDELNNKYIKVLNEAERLKEEMRGRSVELSEKIEEIACLKYSLSELEQQHKQDKESLMAEICHQQKKVETSVIEIDRINITLEKISNEKEAYIKRCDEEHQISQKSIFDLKESPKQGSIQMLEHNEAIAVLHCSLNEKSSMFDCEKGVGLLQESVKETPEVEPQVRFLFEEMKREKDETVNLVEKSSSEIYNLEAQGSHLCKGNEELVTRDSSSDEKTAVVMITQFQKENENMQLLHLMSEIELLKESLHTKEMYIHSQQDDCSRKDRRIAELENQIQQHSKVVQGYVGTQTCEMNKGQHQDTKIGEECKSKEHLQRKLHAALISRKDVLKENKSLKDKIDSLILEKQKLLDTVSSLEHSLAEFAKDTQKTDLISSLYQDKDCLVSENDRLLTENENLSAACESLKSTMETIVQEKEAFSVQLNSLQESQMVELSGWKTKHSELNKEYESLLQAYENISDEMDKMRQIIEITRKEKQNVLHRLQDLESKNIELEKLIHSREENDNVNDNLREIIKSKDVEIKKFQSEAERLGSFLKSTIEDKSLLSELSLENLHLLEENNKLKDISENLKMNLQRNQNENDRLQNDIHETKSILGELQSQMDLNKSDMRCKLDDVFNERESLLNQVTCLTNEISEKMVLLATAEEDRKVTLEKLKEAEEILDQKNIFNCKLENEVKHFKHHIMSLNEKVKILEDDKCLLQEELENIQEHSDNIKYEKEFLETEILNNIKQIDYLTDTLKAVQLQNGSLMEQLEDLKMERCSAIHDKKEQQLQLVREFEEKVKGANRENSSAKNKSKELQELLKEKQQEIHQLQKDSIHFQELILNLERTAKISQSKSEKIEKDFNTVTDELSKSREEGHILNEKLNSCNSLLNEAKTEIASLSTKNLKMQAEIKKNEEDLKLQKMEFERKIQFGDEELKIAHKEELQALQESYDSLSREKDRLLDKLDEIKNELGIKDLKNKTLQSDLNTNMARLAAFTQCMSSLQNDRDRALDEMKTWENQFKDAIQNKERQIDESNLKIMLLQDEVKEKVTQIQELETKYYVLEESHNVGTLKTHINTQHSQKLACVQQSNSVLLGRLQEFETTLQSKEEVLQTLSCKNYSFKQPTMNSTDAVKEVEILERKMMQKDQEWQRVSLENDELRASLQKQLIIARQLKLMLNSKDSEISMLVSSKGDDNSGYLTHIQTVYRQKIEDYAEQLSVLQTEKEQSDEAFRRMENELKNLRLKGDKACQEKSEIANEIEALKKSMSSHDGIDTFTESKQMEQHHKSILGQNESAIVQSTGKNIDLKQEVRKLLNEIDDLHSENAMLRAQLIRYREDLNQVLSLKDHQLKELLKQQLDHIKHLEQEKCKFQKEHKEVQRVNALQKEKIEILQHENGKILSKTKDLESLIVTINKENIVSEYKGKQKKGVFDNRDQTTDAFKIQAQDKHGKIQKLADNKDTEDLYKGLASQHDIDPLEDELETLDEIKEKCLLEVKYQNADLKSQNESFGKAMAALQDDRDRLIEDFKVLQSKYASELKSEQIRGDNLDVKLNNFESRLSRMLKENNFGNVSAVEDKDALDQLDSEIKTLCQMLSNRDLEITRLSSECGNYAQQIDAFSKAMASLQDDRDRLLQQLREVKIVHETKQGVTSVIVPSDTSSNENVGLQNGKLGQDLSSLSNAEMVQLKSRVDDLERALQKAKDFQERTENEVSLYQAELAELRTEKSLLVTEARALRDQCHRTIAEKDRQISELQTFHQEMISKESTSIKNIYAMKALETSSLVGNANIPDQVKQLMAEKNQLQHEMQRCLQEMHQRERRFQQINAKDDMRAEVPPGAPQERASVIVEIDNMELSDLRKRLVEIEQHYDSSQQEVSQLAEKLEEEKTRRKAAEEALVLAEQHKRLGASNFISVPREYEYAVQMESDDEREALIIDPREHIVARKMKGGALSVRRWLRGRSIYCSKLLTSRAKSRYLFFTYLVTLHIVVVLCLAGVI